MVMCNAGPGWGSALHVYHPDVAAQGILSVMRLAMEGGGHESGLGRPGQICSIQ